MSFGITPARFSNLSAYILFEKIEENLRRYLCLLFGSRWRFLLRGNTVFDKVSPQSQQIDFHVIISMAAIAMCESKWIQDHNLLAGS